MTDILKGIIVFIITIGAMAFFYGTCNFPVKKDHADTVTVYRTDTFVYTPPPVIIHAPAKVRFILSPSGGGNVDSLRKIIAVRDSLKKELAKFNVRELLTLDTVTKNNDTVNIKADCISQNISFMFRPSPQKIEIKIPERTITKTVYEEASFLEKAGYFMLGLGVGFGVQELRK